MLTFDAARLGASEGLPRGDHPRAARALTWDSIDHMASFDAFRFIDLIAPRPLLMITPTRAVTASMTHDAHERAGGSKRLHTIAKMRSMRRSRSFQGSLPRRRT